MILSFRVSSEPRPRTQLFFCTAIYVPWLTNDASQYWNIHRNRLLVFGVTASRSKWKSRAVSVPGSTKNHKGLILPLTRLTKANVPGNSNRPFHAFFFQLFLRTSQRKSVEFAGKRAFSKIVKFESDLLTTNKDVAPQSHEILQTFVWRGVHTCPNHTNVFKFSPLCRDFPQLIFHNHS